jgi:hypothetical protein
LRHLADCQTNTYILNIAFGSGWASDEGLSDDSASFSEDELSDDDFAVSDFSSEEASSFLAPSELCVTSFDSVSV